MAGNTIGELFRVTTFGESHGPALGAIVDGVPPGLTLTEADLQIDLDRRVDVTDLLKQIQAPTLVIGCKHDHVIPVEHARGLAGAVRGAQYVEIDAGHLAPFERPDVFGDLVVEFCEASAARH